jgi:DNA-binding MarR family transcriptional regulator
MKNLRDEIQQGRPFESRAQAAFLNLQRTAWRLRKESTEHLRSAGLSIAQYNVLRILRGAGETGLTCREIGDRMVTPDSDVTRLVDRGEGQGWVTRRRCTKDRRVVHITITDTGLALIAGQDEGLLAHHHEQLRHLSDAELDTLNTLLEKARFREGEPSLDRHTETTEGESHA